MAIFTGTNSLLIWLIVIFLFIPKIIGVQRVLAADIRQVLSDAGITVMQEMGLFLVR